MKVVTVHRGSRDGYQVPGGLAEAGLLEALVTDLYWPASRSWAKTVERATPGGITAALHQRYAHHVPADTVKLCLVSGAASFAMSKVPHLPFDWKRDTIRWCDRSLGRKAGKIATERRAALLAYSYYGHSAFSSYAGEQPRILFQLHPHPASVRTILKRERELNPDCAPSLDKEWELALPQAEFEQLEAEPAMADFCLAASHFTKRTLVESGVPSDRVAVIPYGIDTTNFAFGNKDRATGRPLRLLFVGTLCQRKGVKYLLQALELLPAGSVELTVCGRQVDDLALFSASKVPIRLFPSISSEGLSKAYQYADVFVFPSLAEGFAHVLLEAMASGLPIISTDRTAAPDLIDHNVQGFLVEPSSATDLALHIEKFLKDPSKTISMGEAARRRAEYFTWKRFRSTLAETVSGILYAASDLKYATSGVPTA